MVLGTVRPEAGPCERQLKVAKTRLAQGGPSGLSPLRSHGSRDGERWPKTLKGGLENNSRNRHKTEYQRQCVLRNCLSGLSIYSSLHTSDRSKREGWAIQTVNTTHFSVPLGFTPPSWSFMRFTGFPISAGFHTIIL
jgi:hypothetical protein